MVAAVAGVPAASHHVTPRDASRWLKAKLKVTVIFRSTDKLDIVEPQNVSNVLLV